MAIDVRLTIKVRDKLGACLVDSDREDYSLKAMDRIDFQVNFFGLHLLFQESKCVNVFNHCFFFRAF